MVRWEYGFCYFEPGTGNRRFVQFTNGERWEPLKEADFLAVMGRLGVEGWEVVHFEGYVSYWKRRLPE